MYVHSFILLVWAPFCARELELFLCSECYRSFELFLPQFTGNTEAHRTTGHNATVHRSLAHKTCKSIFTRVNLRSTIRA